ncbi:translocase of chloroplast 132 chloroplastic [Phtheirospermum japonicum]|uniref:Translocase of chloroplast 132 chloroplastic n=1 Tax=Phtheirospermum japonicum TaxID=374723 RepID=A0A830CQ58_9LAMI|nr:translocase of chloroplast 132 chloroplastic [Phtheirospermum japonicum]
MAVTVILLLAALFFMGFFSVYIRRLNIASVAADSSPPSTASASRGRPPPPNRKGTSTRFYLSNNILLHFHDDHDKSLWGHVLVYIGQDNTLRVQSGEGRMEDPCVRYCGGQGVGFLQSATLWKGVFNATPGASAQLLHFKLEPHYFSCESSLLSIFSVMENGITIAKDAKLGEGNAVNAEVLEQSERENVDLSLDGSKDFDGDEVFEEAVEAETATTGSENSAVATKDGNVELSGSLENNKRNSDLVHEFHKSDEGIRAPGADRSSEDAGAKTENSMSEEKQIGVEKTGRDETNGSTDDGMAENNDSVVEDGKAEFCEIVDSASPAGETVNLNDGYEKLDDSYRKPEDNISGKMSFLEALTSGGVKTLDTDNGEEPIVEMLKTLEPNESCIAESDPEKLDVEPFPHESTETQDANTVEGGDINCSLDHVNLASAFNHKDMKSANALKEHIHETSHGIEDEDGAKESVADSNGDVLHKNEQTAILDSGNRQYKNENNSATHHSDFEEDLVEKSCTSRVNPKKKLDFETVQVEKADCQVADQEENSGIAASDTSATNHAKESSGLDDSTLNLEKNEVEPQLSSSEWLAESSRSSFQPELVDCSAGVSTNIIERREQESVEDEKKELDSSGNNREHEARPFTGGISSASDLDHADKFQEPVSQDTSVNGRQETKSALNISSANSLTNRAAALTHPTPLSEPASQNKKQGFGSSAVIPSTNITPATHARPAGLGRVAPLLEPTSRVVQHPRVNGAVSAPQNQHIEGPTNAEVEEYDETREKLQMIRVKFLRLAHRLGQTPHNVVVAQVLYRLGLAEQLHGRSGGRVAAFSFDRASAMAEQLEAAGQEPLDFTCTIMVIGKTGVGKSATINSIFDEVMFGTDAFHLGTKKVQDIVGTVQGIRVRVIDTPGLLPSWSDQRQNEKILYSVKRFMKKTTPDIVLYLDRLDMQSRDFGEMPLLRTITEIFGPSIWFNAIVVLTHAASAPPEGPNGTATSYDMFVTQRSHVVQQAIRQAAGDMRLMNPVSLVENHSACRTNRAGQRVLPNGQVWKPHLLLLSFASKILAEANTLLKLQDTPPGRPFAPRTRSPPLPFLLSSLLQSRPEIKLPSEQFGDDDDNDAIGDDLDGYSDSEEESEYDGLPPFKSLTKAQLENLSKVQRKAYYDELEYREKLFMKKQLKEERKRRKMIKKLQEAAKDLPLPAKDGDNNEEETSGAASVPVPMPDLALPASFDSDNPTHRYRSLDSSNPWLVRAVLEPNGWDHDIGYDGINVERLFVAKEKIPISFSGHISKDKKDASLQMEVASSVKHRDGKTTSLGFDLQSVGKDYAYTLRSETRFSNHRINKATAGLSATVLGDVITGGVKLQDKLIIGKRGQLVVAGGAIYGRGEIAYGGSLEATVRDKDHPLGRFLMTLGLSVMDWHGDLAIGCNSQTQIPIGRHTNMIGRINLNNRGSGQFSVKINSSEQLQIVLIGLIPLVKKILGYSQQAQYG